MSYQETIFHHTCGNSFFHETSPWCQKDWVVAQMVSACNAGDLGSIPGLGRSPEKEMATHSNILAWRIPWTEEPGGLQSMGSQRVGHD